MKRLITSIVTILLALFGSCEREDNNLALLRLYGDAFEDVAFSIAAAESDIIISGLRTVIIRRDGNYIESSVKNMGIVRAGEDGMQKWEITPGSDRPDMAKKSIVLSSGDVLTVGYTTRGQIAEPHTDIYTVRTNAGGTVLWESVIGGIGNQVAYDVVVKPGGGFIIAGVTDAYRAESGSFPENIAGMQDFFFLEMNESGDSLSSYAFGYGGNDICKAIKRDIGGGYIMYGTTDNSSEPGLDKNSILLIRLNEDGSNRGAAIIGSQNDEYAADIEILPNGYLIAYNIGEDTENNQIGLIRLSANIQEPPAVKKEFNINGLSSKVNSICKGAGGIYYLGGRVGTATSSDMLIAKVDSDAELIAAPFISGGAGSQEIFDLISGSRGFILAAGKTGYENNTMMCLLRIKY
ncbi:MAG: hypothetical protein R6W67_12470 [Bacteroidales bacterium]